MFTQSFLNEIYAKVKNRFGNKIVQPGTLILEAALQNGKSTYQFHIKKGTGSSERSSERRLDQNDAFVAVATGLFLKKEDSAKGGSAPIYTFPNATVFAAETDHVVTADLESVYNSSLAVKVGDVVYNEAMDMNPCRVVRSAATEKLSMDGYVANTPIITFDGTAKNEITLTLPNYTGQSIQYSTANAGNTIYLQVRYFGFLVSGGGAQGNLL